MDNPFQSPAILSLCTGMRGLERGIERAIGPVRTELILEIEAFIIENMVGQMEQGVLAPTPIFTNIKTFDPKPFRGKIHGITGGYPCQPFSVAGEQQGVEDPRHLWPYIFGIIGTIRPVWCFFENVPGHITIGYREVRSQLQSIGYKIEQGIFSAAEVGASHNRKRLFILAIKMEHATKQRLQESGLGGQWKLSKERRQRMDNRLEQSGDEELANSEYNGCSPSEIRGSIESRNDGDEKGENSAMQSERCSELANSGCSRGTFGISEPEQREERNSGVFDHSSNKHQWPSGPGQNQYSWEEPRVKSSVGFTVNGYNFREDLLRMAGNGVVEQTAELAFRTLLNKFL